MRDDGGQAIFFYSRHAITAEIIQSKLRASRGNLDGLRPEDLYPHDQDHYGGLEANDVLAGGDGTARTRGSRISAPGSGVQRAIWRAVTAPLSPASNSRRRASGAPRS